MLETNENHIVVGLFTKLQAASYVRSAQHFNMESHATKTWDKRKQVTMLLGVINELLSHVVVRMWTVDLSDPVFDPHLAEAQTWDTFSVISDRDKRFRGTQRCFMQPEHIALTVVITFGCLQPIISSFTFPWMNILRITSQFKKTIGIRETNPKPKWPLPSVVDSLLSATQRWLLQNSSMEKLALWVQTPVSLLKKNHWPSSPQQLDRSCVTT